MLSDCIEPGRRNMTISVTVLGVALLTVLMAYLVFGDDNDQEGLATLRLIGIVGLIHFFGVTNRNGLTVNRYFVMATDLQRNYIQTIHI